jgi:hypothetical protein
MLKQEQFQLFPLMRKVLKRPSKAKESLIKQGEDLICHLGFVICHFH